MGGLSLVTKGMLCRPGISDSTAVIVSGEIELEPNVWQLIAVPVIHGYWDTNTSSLVTSTSIIARVKNYIVAQLEDKYVGGGETIGDYVEIINTYFGDINAFYTWNAAAPPPDASPHNFPLVYVDGTRKEVAGIWVKSVTASLMILEWASG